MKVERVIVAISHAPANPTRAVVRVVATRPESAARLSQRLGVIPDRPHVSAEYILIVKEKLRT
jgi:hypothetical protein